MGHRKGGPVNRSKQWWGNTGRGTGRGQRPEYKHVRTWCKGLSAFPWVVGIPMVRTEDGPYSRSGCMLSVLIPMSAHLSASPHACVDLVFSRATPMFTGGGGCAAEEQHCGGGTGACAVGELEFVRTVWVAHAMARVGRRASTGSGKAGCANTHPRPTVHPGLLASAF